MHLTRREFAAATAGGLSLFSWGAVASRNDAIRHAHLELPAGPYSRAELSRLIAAAAQAAGYTDPASMTALGAEVPAENFPAHFALTVCFPGGRSLAVRASRHANAPELTLRGQHTCTELRYWNEDHAFLA